MHWQLTKDKQTSRQQNSLTKCWYLIVTAATLLIVVTASLSSTENALAMKETFKFTKNDLKRYKELYEGIRVRYAIKEGSTATSELIKAGSVQHTDIATVDLLWDIKLPRKINQLAQEEIQSWEELKNVSKAFEIKRQSRVSYIKTILKEGKKDGIGKKLVSVIKEIENQSINRAQKLVEERNSTSKYSSDLNTPIAFSSVGNSTEEESSYSSKNSSRKRNKSPNSLSLDLQNNNPFVFTTGTTESPFFIDEQINTQSKQLLQPTEESDQNNNIVTNNELKQQLPLPNILKEVGKDTNCIIPTNTDFSISSPVKLNPTKPNTQQPLHHDQQQPLPITPIITQNNPVSNDQTPLLHKQQTKSGCCVIL